MEAKNGNAVILEYTGKLEDGTIFDASEKHGKPLAIKLGANMVIPGFEKALIGVKKGDKKEIKIAPEDGYGQPDPRLVQEIPKEEAPEPDKLKKDMVLLAQLPNGAKVPVKIVDVTDKTVTIDLNHPLAGKTLIFELSIVDVQDGKAYDEMLKKMHNESCCGHDPPEDECCHGEHDEECCGEHHHDDCCGKHANEPEDKK